MAKPKVLVVAEGPSEIGELDQLAGGGSRRSRRLEGFIPPMLRKLLGPVEITAQRVTTIGRYDARPRLRGQGDRAAKALALAAADGCALLVFVKDVDRQPGRKKSDQERKRRLATMHEEIDAGFAAVNDAGNVARVKATPCRMIEAWALGDPAALRDVGGKKIREDQIPRRPEDLWGDEQDPASNHPKCVLTRVLGRVATAEVFEHLGGESSPKALGKTCPESFAPFLAEVDAAARRLSKTIA